MEPDLRALLTEAQQLLDAQKRWEDGLDSEGRADVRNIAAGMLAYAGAELGLSAVDDFAYGRPLAGTVVGRAILETAVTLRWCLVAEENADRWWRAGDAEIQKSLRALGVSQDPRVVAIRDAETVGVGLPSVQKRAEIGGLRVAYRSWYPTLSPYSHVGRVALGFAYGPPGTERPAPPVVPIRYFLGDVARVLHGWSTNRSMPSAAAHP